MAAPENCADRRIIALKFGLFCVWLAREGGFFAGMRQNV